VIALSPRAEAQVDALVAYLERIDRLLVARKLVAIVPKERAGASVGDFAPWPDSIFYFTTEKCLLEFLFAFVHRSNEVVPI
jgi:hypothetical protein